MLRRFDPLWNSVVVGGLVEGKPFLGTVGMLGTHYSDEHVATGEFPFHTKSCGYLPRAPAFLPKPLGLFQPKILGSECQATQRVSGRWLCVRARSSAYDVRYICKHMCAQLYLFFTRHVACLNTHCRELCTGFGNQLARPLFRAKHKPDMNEGEALDLIKEALEVRPAWPSSPRDLLICSARPVPPWIRKWELSQHLPTFM